MSASLFCSLLDHYTIELCGEDATVRRLEEVARPALERIPGLRLEHVAGPTRQCYRIEIRPACDPHSNHEADRHYLKLSGPIEGLDTTTLIELLVSLFGRAIIADGWLFVEGQVRQTSLLVHQDPQPGSIVLLDDQLAPRTSLSHAVPLSRVLYLHEDVSVHSALEPLPAKRRLLYSSRLVGRWLLQPLVVPGWRHFLPHVPCTSDAARHAMIRRLAQLEHASVRGPIAENHDGK
jgi:hypothetical protein